MRLHNLSFSAVILCCRILFIILIYVISSSYRIFYKQYIYLLFTYEILFLSILLISSMRDLIDAYVYGPKFILGAIYNNVQTKQYFDFMELYHETTRFSSWRKWFFFWLLCYNLFKLSIETFLNIEVIINSSRVNLYRKLD